jgi:hypothetical protein
VAAHTIANSIVDLLNALEENDYLYSHYLSERNLDLIELLSDEYEEVYGDEAEETRRVVRLNEVEMEQQDRDLDALQGRGGRTQIEAVRITSSKKSLYGRFWFPNVKEVPKRRKQRNRGHE